MTFQEYQSFAKSTAIYPQDQGLAYVALGLCGEAGEISNKVKKIIRDDHGRLTIEKQNLLADELGDLCWYIASMASELGLDLEVIHLNNMNKLKSRQERQKLSGSGDLR